MNVDDIVAQCVEGYVECAIWADAPYNEEGTAELEFNAPDLDYLAGPIEQHVRDFVTENIEDIVLFRHARTEATDYDWIGHDLRLTEGGHGTGFWDRFYDGGENEKRGRRLADACRFMSGGSLWVDEEGDLQWQGI